MKKILKNKFVMSIFILSMLVISSLFITISFSLGGDGNQSVWSRANFLSKQLPRLLSAISIVLFIVMLLSLIGAIVSFIFRKKIGLWISSAYHIGLSLFLIFVQIISSIFHGGSIALIVFTLLFSILSIVPLFFMNDGEKNTSDHSSLKKFFLIFNGVELLILLIMFFIPFVTLTIDGKQTSYSLSMALGNSTNQIFLYIIFLVYFLIFFSTLLFFISTIPNFFYDEQKFIKKNRHLTYVNLAITIIFFLAGFITTFVYKTKGTSASTVAIIPFVLMTIIAIVQAIIQGKYFPISAQLNEKKDTCYPKIESLIYIVLFTILLSLSLFLNVIHLKVGYLSFLNEIKLTGFKLLNEYSKLGGGYQILSFLLVVFYLTSSVLCVLCIISFFTKLRDYYKLIKVSAIINILILFILGLSGTYFQISQKINEDNILTLLKSYGLSLDVNYTYTISSQTIYLFFAGLAIIIVMLIRKQFNLQDPTEFKFLATMEDTTSSNNQEASNEEDKEDNKEEEKDDNKDQNKEISPDFDACPAFTEIDLMHKKFERIYLERKETEFTDPTLPRLIQFVVEYAKNCRLHLSYTPEDIATFVAGLGASRLAILQGMSGTGKTSLPKIFMEAIMGQCEIIEVESSWRDKNELLGYYNEFSKMFTPKKFTQALYKAKLNSDIPTFIVLDEMNLSRIEYYFSDFLSLMENEEDKREIKLLNTKIYRKINQKNIAYRALRNGHTLPIPTNVWFIGTANRDESTFEISDKVYDRAQTMNFNKRAPKIASYGEVLNPQFLPYTIFNTLLSEAKESGVFDAEENPLIQKVEALLLPYNISFGNRILRQMEAFIKIYCACFNDSESVLNTAIEKILFSKVVSKLEYKNVENKEQLALEFDKLKLYTCSAFVRKLNED